MSERGDCEITIVVPAYNQAASIAECLSALEAAAAADTEIIVVDDGSTDDTFSRAARTSARVYRMLRNSRHSAARNYGARRARGRILFFVDADVVVGSGALDRIRSALAAHTDAAAVFGSYDAHPRAPGIVSQYRNLLHHFVHQHGNPEASTFWAGCGAVRRAAFEAVGGFDEAQFGIEDIELGYRLRRAGYRIVLDRDLLVTHLKRWTLPSCV